MAETAQASQEPPLVSIVVVTYNALSYVRASLESVLARTTVPFELIVVDNASDDETRAYLRSLKGIQLIENEKNLLWCAGCNIGLRAADPRSRYLLLLNSDIEVLREDWLQVMIGILESDPRIAIVGPEQHRMPIGPLFGWIDGHCLLFRRELLNLVGQLDEQRWPWAGAPAELAVAAYAKGWIYKKVHPDDALVFHHGQRSHTAEIKTVLRDMPRPKKAFRQIIERYGIRPIVPFYERGTLFRPLTRILDRFRFYYAPPSGAQRRS